MDSIFQIKINENKLQRILTEISKNQATIFQSLAQAKQTFVRHTEEHCVFEKQVKGKFQAIQTKIMEGLAQLDERFNAAQQRVYNIIENTRVSHVSRMERLDEMMATHYSSLNENKSQLEKRFTKIHETLTAQSKLQPVKEKEDDEDLPAKIQKLQKMMGKMAQATQLLQNKNLLYFLQMMIEKQQGLFKQPDEAKQFRNPFTYETGQQKVKRYRELKRSLEDTHNKIQSMQYEYTGYFYTAVDENKQNRHETHMYYAMLSTKIKQLEDKILDLEIQKTVVNKILYPSEGRDRKEKSSSKVRNESQVNSSKNIGFKTKDQIVPIVKEELEPVKELVDQTRKQIKTKIEKMEDQIWSHSNRLQSLKISLHYIKIQIDKCNQKVKGFNFNYSTEKDQAGNKTAGLLGQFRNLQDEVQTKIKTKVEIVQFKNTLQQHGEKFKIIGEQIEEKANRDQTRKAFHFFQEKIREIVTILAEMKNSSKKTAARKMMMQCLSCDENFFDEAQSSLKSRPTTSGLTSPRTNSTLKLRLNELGDRTFRRSNI